MTAPGTERVAAPSAFEAQAARAKIWMLSPLLLTLALVAGWPLLRTIYASFTDAWLSSSDSRFIGFANYVALMQDPRWLRAVLNTLAFAFVSVTLETILGVAIALVLNANMPGRGWARAAMLIPWAIPTVVSAKMWAWMLNDLNGVVNIGLMKLGVIAEPIAWLADPWLAMASVIARERTGRTATMSRMAHVRFWVRRVALGATTRTQKAVKRPPRGGPIGWAGF